MRIKTSELTRHESDMVQWSARIDDLLARLQHLQERILESLCTGRDLSNAEQDEIKSIVEYVLNK